MIPSELQWKSSPSTYRRSGRTPLQQPQGAHHGRARRPKRRPVLRNWRRLRVSWLAAAARITIPSDLRVSRQHARRTYRRHHHGHAADLPCRLQAHLHYRQAAAVRAQESGRDFVRAKQRQTRPLRRRACWRHHSNRGSPSSSPTPPHAPVVAGSTWASSRYLEHTMAPDLSAQYLVLMKGFPATGKSQVARVSVAHLAGPSSTRTTSRI